MCPDLFSWYVQWTGIWHTRHVWSFVDHSYCRWTVVDRATRLGDCYGRKRLPGSEVEWHLKLEYDGLHMTDVDMRYVGATCGKRNQLGGRLIARPLLHT